MSDFLEKGSRLRKGGIKIMVYIFFFWVAIEAVLYLIYLNDTTGYYDTLMLMIRPAVALIFLLGFLMWLIGKIKGNARGEEKDKARRTRYKSKETKKKKR